MKFHSAAGLLAVGLAISGAAHAYPVCVSTDQQLDDALYAATSQPMTVFIARGTYNIYNSTWGTASVAPTTGGSDFLGGYNADCSTRINDASNTVITSSNSYPIRAWATGNVVIENLTFQHDFEIEVDNQNFDADPGTLILLRRVKVLNGHFAMDWWQDTDLGGHVRIVDSIFGHSNDAPCAIDLNVVGGQPLVELVNNTIANNTLVDTQFYGGGICVFNGNSDAYGYFALYNNILHNNTDGTTAVDIYSNTPKVELGYNIVGTQIHPPYEVPQVGSLNVDPLLDANFRPSQAPASPAINSGTTSVPGGLPALDVAGHNRWIGSEPDRGAFETTIDDAFTQMVTNNNDSGNGSLRQAIINANATTGLTIIGFSIGTGCGPHVITLNSALPALSRTVLMDARYQPGAVINDMEIGDDAKICVVLDGKTNNIANGFTVPASAGNGVQATISGFAFSGFTHAGVNLQGGSQHFVTGNRFGGFIGAMVVESSGTAVDIGNGVTGVRIGGDDPGDRNIVGFTVNAGITVDAGAHGNDIVGNYVGLGWNNSTHHFTDIGNLGDGIDVSGYANTVRENVVGQNGNDGIDINGANAHDNDIDSNFVGFAPDASVQSNDSKGVRIDGAAHDNNVHLNTIAYNAGEGVRVVDGAHNKIRKNTIRNNGGIGIDLVGEGVTANDDDGATLPPDLANRGLNYPVLTAAGSGAHSGTVHGTLTTTAGDYTIDFYLNDICDSTGHGEGGTWNRSATVTVPIPGSGHQGTATFALTISAPGSQNSLPGKYITATATDADGNTSEFSSCLLYDDTIFKNGYD